MRPSNTILSNAREFAGNAGYYFIIFIGLWKGYCIFEAINDDVFYDIDKHHYILARGSEVRWGTVEECDIIFDDWLQMNI